MMLSCTVTSEYLDKILAGEESLRIGQCDELTMTDDLGRAVTIAIDGIYKLTPKERSLLASLFSDDRIIEHLPVFRFSLGSILVRRENLYRCLGSTCWKHGDSTGGIMGYKPWFPECQSCEHLISCGFTFTEEDFE